MVPGSLPRRPGERACEGIGLETKPGAARMPCVVRYAPSALLTMTYIIDSIEKLPHPRPAPGQALRKPQRGCLEDAPCRPSHPLIPSHARKRGPGAVGAVLAVPCSSQGQAPGARFRGHDVNGDRCQMSKFAPLERFPIKFNRAHPSPPPKPSRIKGEGLCQRGWPVSAGRACVSTPHLYSRPLDGGGSGWG